MKQLCSILFLLCIVLHSKAQLIINELSQGPSGTKEYVELLVTGAPVCNGANTVDLRGWIIDDNNSWHGSGAGTGIAGGHVRFAAVSQWANVKIGTLILIYNDADTSSAVAALSADTSDANSDCVYIVPVSSSVLDKNTTLPVSNGNMTTYNVGGTTYTSTGNWTVLGMANAADAFHTVSPSDYAVPYHSIGWGINTTLLNVYFSGSQSGKVIYMANTVNNDPYNQANFIDTTASTDETPGVPNNAANAAWISSLNNNCQPFISPVVNIATPLVLTCTQTSVVLSATSNPGNVSYQWGNGATSATDTVSSPGLYRLTVSDAGGVCTTVDSINVTQDIASPNVTITQSSPLNCSGAGSDTLNASSIPANVTYDWGGGNQGATNIVTTAGTYTVTATSTTNGCSATAAVTVSSSGGISITVSGVNTTCGNSNGSATVTLTSGSAQSYAWNNGGTTSAISNLAAGTYRITVDAGGGCMAVDSVVILPSGNTPVSITADRDTMCSGDTASICAPSGYASYVWNVGPTTRCIAGTQAGNYYVTVTDLGGCTATSNHLQLAVLPLPPVSISVNGDTLTAYNAVSYRWFRNGALIVGASSSVYIATQPGSYTVEVTDANGCHATSSAVTVVTGLEEMKARAEAQIYPNPTRDDMFYIRLTDRLLGETIQLLDATGRLVYTAVASSTHMQVPLQLPQGVYLLKISAGEQAITRKVVRL